MSVSALGAVIATALESARAVDEERIRAIVREELATFRPDTTAAWMSPPAAAKAKGIPPKRVYALIREGRLEVRAKNSSSKHPKWEISMRSLDVALAGGDVPHQEEPARPIDAASWAAARARAKKGT